MTGLRLSIDGLLKYFKQKLNVNPNKYSKIMIKIYKNNNFNDELLINSYPKYYVNTANEQLNMMITKNTKLNT